MRIGGEDVAVVGIVAACRGMVAESEEYSRDGTEVVLQLATCTTGVRRSRGRTK